MPAGVVSFWRAESNALDSAGNNNGVLLGEASYGEGMVGNAFVLDGDRDAVMVGTATNLQLQSFTIEGWIKRTSATVASFNGNSNAQLFVVGTYPGGLSYVLQQSDSRLALNISGGVSVSTAAKVADTNWHHIAVTKDEAKVTFYVDGEGYPPVVFDAGPFTFSATACLGGWVTRAGQVENSFRGALDEFAVFHRPLTPGEVAAIYAASTAGKCPGAVSLPDCVEAPPGLLCWWRAEDDAFDSVGISHGTLCGGARFAAGKVGKGFCLDQAGSGVRINTPTRLQLQDFSIEAWIKRFDADLEIPQTNHVAVIFAAGVEDRSFCLFLLNNGLIGFGSRPGQGIISDARVADSNWHHVILSKSSSSAVIYFDAVPHPVSMSASGGFSFEEPGYIGAWLTEFNQLRNNFCGVIDEVGLYGRCLRAAEVLSLFNAGNAGKCLKHVSPTIIVQPATQIVTEGESVIHSVTVAGSPPISYQWRRYGVSIAGAHESSLLEPEVQPSDAGIYSVEVTNPYGSALSSNALLTVNLPPDCAPTPLGLVSWWQGEGDALDVLTEKRGSQLSQVAYSKGKVGLAFTFTGENQLVCVPDSPSLNPTNEFTLECWFYVERFSTNDGVVVVNKEDPALDRHQYGLGLVNFSGKWVASAFIGPPAGYLLLQGETSISSRKWYHVAMTYDGGMLCLYLNGTFENGAKATGPVDASKFPLLIGGHPTGPWNLNGRVDEISLYHRAIAPAEIEAIYLAGGTGKCPLPPALKLPDNLVGWWRAESNTTDSVNGVAPGSITRVTFEAGKVGTALSYDGDGCFVIPTNTVSQPIAKELTLAVWVYVEQFPLDGEVSIVGRFLPKAPAPVFGICLARQGGKFRFEAKNGLTFILGSEVVTTQTWHYVVITCDERASRLYVNGVLDGRASTVTQLDIKNSPLRIGENHSRIVGFKGRVDEVCFYNRALSSVEIAANCLSGSVGKPIGTSLPSDLELRRWLFRPSRQKPIANGNR